MKPIAFRSTSFDDMINAPTEAEQKVIWTLVNQISLTDLTAIHDLRRAFNIKMEEQSG